MKVLNISHDSNTKLVLSFILHTLILFTILSGLFLFLITVLESQGFKISIGHMMDSNIPEMLRQQDQIINQKLPGEVRTDILTVKEILKNVPLKRLVKEYLKPDETTKISNQNLVNLIIFSVIAGTLLFVGMLLVLKFSCGLNAPIMFIFIENLIIFLFVGAFEAYFFLTVGIKYIPVPPSFVINRIFDNLKSL
jgi:hypothetical protein